MNYNHDLGLIDTVLTLDTTTPPPLGGQVNSLEIVGNGSLIVPKGLVGDRPGTPVSGMFRYNTSSNTLEYWNTTAWATLGTGSGSGTVTSVSVAGSTGISSAGGPITSSGTITLTLNAELQALSGLSTNGVVVRTAAGTYAMRTIGGTTSNISVVNGDGVGGNPVIDLINIGSPVTGSFVKLTTDAKGRVSSTTAVVSSDITSLVDATYVNVTGDTMNSGANLTFAGGGEILGLPTTPSGATAAASKAYVDTLSQGLDPKGSTRAATTVAGTLSTSFASGQVIDGVTLAAGDRILVKNQSAAAENGIYVVTGGAPTRASDFDAWNEIPSAFVFVEEGSANADTGWTCTSNAGGTLGTTSIIWTQFSGVGSFVAGAGLTLTGNSFSITAPVSPTLGGSGTTTAPSAGQVMIGTSGGTYTPATIGSGAGISISSASGAITVNNTGVLSVTGTANQVTVTPTSGNAVVSLPSTVTTTNLILTGLVANTMMYVDGSKQLTSLPAATNGQVLVGSTGAAPTLATLTAGSAISVVNAAGSITINNTGVISLAAGTGIGISGSTGAVTISNTGVTSVGLSLPSFLTVSNSPVTTTGTLTASLASQTMGTVFVAPVGGNGAPTFRALAQADLSTAIQLYRENSSTPVIPQAAGTNASAIGSNASAPAAESLAMGNGSSARTWGSKVMANGSFATAGDAQNGTYVLRNITSNASVTELFLDGATGAQRLVMANNSVYTFSIIVAARRTDAVGGGAGYRIDGVARKDSTAGSTTIIGTPSKSILGETTAAWDVTVDVDTTNGSLRVRVTGEASKTIRWVATVLTSETTN